VSCNFFDWDEGGGMQHKNLSEDNIKILLVEYQEINNFYKHNDTMAWTMGSILIPLSLGIFAFSVQNFKTIPIEAIILTALISVGLLIIWGSMFERMSFYTQIRKPRLHEIESLLGMKNHLSFEIYSDMDKRRLSLIGSSIGIRRLIKYTIILFLLTWTLLIWVKYSTPNEMVRGILPIPPT
jgi:hypothetical protein